MKSLYTLALLMVVGYGGLAQEKQVYNFETTIISEGTNNFSGGLSKGSNFNGRASVSLGMNLEVAKLWKGGFLFAQGFAAYGGTPSAGQIGDIQPISRIETTDRISLFELWYSHKIGKAEVLVGQHDMNSAFGVNTLSGALINTSFGIFPSIALQTPLSIYPSAATAAKLKIAMGKGFVWQGALYDGKPLSQEENPHSVKRDWNLVDKLFSISEIAYTPETEKEQKSHYKLGAFYHQAGGISLLDSTSAEKTMGVYGTLEQHLISRETLHLAAFMQGGGTSGNQNLTDLYLSTGLAIKGLVPAFSDALTFGLVYSSINNRLVAQQAGALANYRALLELSYQAKLNKHFSIQPDIQYIINPGAQANSTNVFAGLLRLSIHY